MHREFGGEYWNTFPSAMSHPQGLRADFRFGGDTRGLRDEFRLGEDNLAVFCGRTAMDCILLDIMKQRQVRTAYLPSYCCYSMVQPFIDHGIRVAFYGVNGEENGEDGLVLSPDPGQACDVFFVMNHFGYQETSGQKWAKHFRERGSIVVEDMTHGFFLEKNHCPDAMYLAASLRKWFPIVSGGLACKMEGTFSPLQLDAPPAAWLEGKIRAMQWKTQYMEQAHVSAERKAHFLALFQEFNQHLMNGYAGYAMDAQSLSHLNRADMAEIRSRRRSNSRVVHQLLAGQEGLRLPFALKETDCPLFVPVLMDPGGREALIRHLIAHRIYCPKHWGFTRGERYSQGESNLYDREWSMLCDQRYDAEEIAYCCRQVLEFFKQAN